MADLRKLTISYFQYFYEQNGEDNKVLKLKQIEQQRQERIISKKQHDSLDLIQLYKDQLLRESLIPLSSQQYQLKIFVQNPLISHSIF